VPVGTLLGFVADTHAGEGHCLLHQGSILGEALFSQCGLYRYALARRLGTGDRACLFVMLNPSTADASTNDATLRRCLGYARSWDYDILYIANFAAYRTTDPKFLYKVDDPIGPYNDAIVMQLAKAAPLVVVAWGVHASKLDAARASAFPREIAKVNDLHALWTNRDGSPVHPLRQLAHLTPQPYEVP
jgi:hypothetical protein